MKLESKFEFSKVQFNKENTLHLLVRAIAPKMVLTEERKPVNIIAVVDESGSMGGNKMEYAKKSLMKMVDHLGSEDRLGIIAFTSEVRTIFEPTMMETKNKDTYKNMVSKLQALSATNFSGGLIEAINQAKLLKGQCRIVMFTDGQANVGISTLEGILDLAKKNLTEDITISCFGYGNDHDVKILTELSKLGKGNYYYIKNPDDALTAFARELGGLLSCSGQNFKFTVMPKDKAKIVKVLSDFTSKELDGGAVQITINDIYSEETKNLVFEVKLDEQPKVFPRESTMFNIELEYVDAKSGETKFLKDTAKIQFVKEKEVSIKADQDVIDQVALCTILSSQREAEEFATRGDFTNARMSMSRGLSSNYVTYSSGNVKNAGETISKGYVNKNAHTLCANDLQATATALSNQRGSGSATTDCLFVDNEVKNRMVDDFKKEDEKKEEPEIKVTIGDLKVSHGSTTSNLTNSTIKPEEKEEKKSSLSKTKSNREW